MKEVIHMKDCNCGYCMGGEILAGFGIKICDLKVSQLILFKEQSHPGRVIVAYKDPVSELVNISAEERALFFEDVATAANAIHKAFSPDKVNYGAYGDGGCHLHFHLVPKYKGEYEWGTPFAMNPGLTKLTDEERNLFFADVATAAKAIHKVFNPDKVNYGAYGDGGCHLHFHLVPKYQGEFEWGTPFAMNPGKTYLTEAEYEDMIAKIKAAL